MPQPLQNNLPILTVSELSGGIKRALETGFSQVRVRGELSRVTHHRNGHVYTDLKDDSAVINTVAWRGTAIPFKLEEGLEVIITGRVSSFPGASRYQLVIESIEMAGAGAILKMLEERRKKLAAEGLFDEARKKPLPKFPARIGVITSPTGAVIRDIIHRVTERFPTHIILWPVAVQGEGAAGQIVEALNGFNALTANHPLRPEVLILARGGGSIEDLMPFNDEAVVRAVAGSTIPIITAVGHETDTTLVDHASDLRAPTPTGAAEKATPVRSELLQTLIQVGQRAHLALSRRTENLRLHLRHSESALRHPRRQLEQFIQRLDDLSARFEPLLTRWLARRRDMLTQLSARLRPPAERIAMGQNKLIFLSEKLSGAWQARVQKFAQQLEQNGALLESYSYKNTLARGYALVMDQDNQIISTVDAAKMQTTMQIKFADGDVRVKPD